MSQATPITFAPLRRQTMPKSIARQVLAAIFSGSFAPDERLVIQRLATELGVSPTPIREALGELQALGMVELQANRGPVVRPFGPRELDEIYQFRAMMEAEATRLACGRIPDAALRANVLALEAAAATAPDQPLDRAFELDLQLHDLVREYCPNRRLATEIARYRDLLPAMRDVAGDGPATQQRALHEHRVVISALLAGDADAAAQAMRAHILSSGAHMQRALFGADKPTSR